MDVSKTHYLKPTIVFVPGAFHTSAHFEPISALLNQASFPTTTVEIPTTARAKTASYRDDVYAIRFVLDKLVEEDGREVMLALHSYAGVPGCQTVSGLERSKRKAEGKSGGVVHVLFIAALLVEQGRGMADALEGGKAPSWAVFKVKNDPTFLLSRMGCNTRCRTGWASLPRQYVVRLLQRPFPRGSRTLECSAAPKIGGQDVCRCG